MKKSIISMLSVAAGVVIGGGVMGKVTHKKIDTTKANSQRYLSLFRMMAQWVKVKQDGKNISVYFQKYGYKKIAIYGMSVAGVSLLNELNDTGITVAYGIDKKADSLYAEVDIFSPEDSLDEVDVIVVTAITFFDEIEEKLLEKVHCPILSLEDILYEV